MNELTQVAITGSLMCAAFCVLAWALVRADKREQRRLARKARIYPHRGARFENPPEER